jgi:hypothetical protein
VNRVIQYLSYRTEFYNLACIHHSHNVRYLTHDCEVMCNEQEAHLKLFLQILEKIENLGLDSHIKCRRWFIGDEQLR